jgi:hypothetical protein
VLDLELGDVMDTKMNIEIYTSSGCQSVIPTFNVVSVCFIDLGELNRRAHDARITSLRVLREEFVLLVA